MPYIVTTKGPVRLPFRDQDEMVIISRRAIATLADARKACLEMVRPAAREAARGPAGSPIGDVCLSLMRNDWSGGTVGPLPDGTLIEVEPSPGQQDMRQQLREWGLWIDTRDALDSTIEIAWTSTFNARQAS